MNNRVISALALAVALASSSAAVSAQSSSNFQLPEGYDPAAYNPDASSGQLPEGYDSTVNTTTPATLPNDMQATVDTLTQQQQGQMLEGDEGSACEAILCLSSGSSPSECMPSLRKYFSINLSKPWKTIQARINFLKMCPTSNDTPQMGTLVEAIGNGAGRCDAATLNQTLRTWTGIDGEYEISNQMPAYCDAYFTHEYTDINSTKPHFVDKYVESSYTDYEGNTIYQYAGGYWVDGGSAAKVAANANGAIPASMDPAAIGF
jgi:hypothetical protein